MLLHIVARGKIGRSPEAELVDRYLKRIAWPTRLTELARQRRHDSRPPRQQRHHRARRARRGPVVDGVRQEARRLARRRQARGALPDRRRRRPWRRRRAARPTCCCPSARRPGRTCWPGRCSPNNCSAPPRSLRTTPIIAKDRSMRRSALLLAAPLLLAAGSAPVAAPRRADRRGAGPRPRRGRRRRPAGRPARSRRPAAPATRRASCAPRQAAAAAAISAAEARISAADARADDDREPWSPRAASASRGSSARSPRLLAGLATMARRPPLLTLGRRQARSTSSSGSARCSTPPCR